jgi:uridine phosphorylase
MQIGASELILNEDGSIYHLNLLPEDLAETVILVGDQNRVPRVSQHFDSLELIKGKREFITHTGWIQNKRISVLSTGIGTDNIDIVLNELDALVNIDLEKREVRKIKKQLDFIRIGTSGAIQPNIPIDSFLVSEYAIGFDNVLHYYQSKDVRLSDIENAFMNHSRWSAQKSLPYVVKCDPHLLAMFSKAPVITGFTGSNAGFYAPQGRRLRIAPEDVKLNDTLATFEFKGLSLTNLEMETSAIYGLSGLMGHRAISLNAIIANRSTLEFSTAPGKTIDRLIEWTLEKILLA